MALPYGRRMTWPVDEKGEQEKAVLLESRLSTPRRTPDVTDVHAACLRHPLL